MRIKIAVLLQCILLLCTQSVSAVNIEMVTVGNPGNAPDMRYNLNQRPEGFGAVNYVYQIGKYEITQGQYTEFLNAVAKADPWWLYRQQMGEPSTYGANIQRTGSSPNYSYSVPADWADRPMNNVSLEQAVQFCNWLHNGQPIGPQGPATTQDGAYHDVFNPNLFGRNANAKFYIPTEDEWYKAAYHDKSAGLVASYFDYPTGTNAVPGNDITEATSPGNNANYYKQNTSKLAIGAPYYRTIVGEFELSESPYGTFDQGGNVWEMNETKITSFKYGVRGGAYNHVSDVLRASVRGDGMYSFERYDFLGFRIAAAVPVPEPTSLALFSIAAGMVGGSRYRTRRGKAS